MYTQIYKHKYLSMYVYIRICLIFLFHLCTGRYLQHRAATVATQHTAATDATQRTAATDATRRRPAATRHAECIVSTIPAAPVANRCKRSNHRNTTHKCCNTLQHAATRCNTLQHAATRCNMLQHDTLQHCLDDTSSI